jgi:putative FmdB family regulatory protein
MPIYEYRCPKGHVFEVFQRMRDSTPEACEVCGAGPVQRVLHPVAIHFKGSGFYATDYGRGSRRPVREPVGSEPGEGGKGESKPAPGKSDSGD